MRKLITAVALVALAVPALALAAKPRPGATYARDGEIALEVFKSGKEMFVRGQTRCAKKAKAQTALPVIKIKRGGTFSFSGMNLPNPRGQRFSVELDGKFTTRDVAKGVVTYWTKGCKDKPVEFTAPILD